MSTLGLLQSRSGALELQASGAEGGRLVLQNLNGFTEEKAEELKHFVESSQSGCLILCLTELNVDWRSSYKSLKEMTRWRCNRHVTMAHNTRDRKDRLYQPGGVAVLSVGEAAARVIRTEIDPSGLGRWCGVGYQLKAQNLWVIVVYRPCVAQGNDTVYQQHIRYLRSVNDERDPRVAVLQDVAGVVARLREQGNWVILAGDFNEDVRCVRIHGMREAVTRYGCGPTHQRGSVPIDGFFTSITLPVTGGGISSSYAVTTSDHYAVWLDTAVFSKTKPKPRQIRKLNVHDPRCEEKYLNYLRAHLTPELDDDQRTAVMVQAESQCRRLFTGGLDYSPTLTKAILWVRLWKLRHKRALGNNVDVSVLIRLEKKVAAEDGLTAPGLSADDTKEGLLQARLALKLVRQQHQALRFQHLSNLAATGAVGINELLERERLRSVFRRIREAIPSKTKRPLFMVRDHEGMWQDTEDSIFYAVVDENKKRFTQTNDTPLRVEPLRSILGDLGEKEAVDNILSGTFDRMDVNPAFVDLLPFLRLPDGVELLDIFTDEDYRKGWRKMDQKTGCQGPLHFGHFKAVSMDDELRGQAVEFLRSTFTSGIPVDRWLQGTDVMLEKQPGEYRVEKLRTILLMQPDFNFGNKMIGRAMMEQAERLHLIPEAQYGSRRSKSSTLQLCNKVLLFELSRLQQVPMGYCSTDAKSNYDRIIHSFAVVALRRWGVPAAVAHCMFATIQNMHHHVRTGFGDSESAYYSSRMDPFQGVGQGNGAGPAIWAAVSAPLFNYMDSRQRGVSFVSPMSKMDTHLSCLAFVDDTDIVYGAQQGALPEVLQIGTQDQLSTWERILRVTGGAIVPEKSFYWNISYDRDKLISQPAQQRLSLSITDCNGAVGSVPHIPVSESRRTLGLLVNPVGCWKAQKIKLREMMELWAEECKVANLPRSDALLELKTRVLPRLAYGLEVTSFSKADCRYIMSPMIAAGLHSIGIVRTLPRPIVFGPESLLGLDLTDLYTMQGMGHLRLLVAHGPLDKGMTGRLIRTLVEEAIVQVGLPGSLFSQDYVQYGCLLRPGWTKTLWEFCWEHQLTITDWIPHILPRREGDDFLIPLARRVIPLTNNSALVSFNKCRRFLKVITMADIMTGDGRSFRKDAIAGARNKWCERPYSFTDSFPVAGDWKIWRETLIKIGGNRIGRWFSTADWGSFVSEDESVLFLPDLVGWSCHQVISRSIRRRRYSLQGTATDELPPGAVRVVIEQRQYGFESSGAQQATPLPLPLVEVADIYIEEFGQPDLDISDVPLTICSDGSYKENRGTASWIAVNCHGERGQDMMVPKGVQDPYRSELCGILGGLRFLDSLSARPTAVRIVCDGKSALEMAFSPVPPSASAAQLDLLQAIHSLRISLMIKGYVLEPVHVKGHADEHASTIGDLSADQRLNIRMDTRAKALWEKFDRTGWPPERKLRDSCTVTYGGVPVGVHNLSEQLKAEGIKRYWMESKKIQGEVDWRSLATATKAVQRGKGIFLTKFFSGLCGVNKWKKRWGLSDTDRCPRCLVHEETTAHLWRCPASEAKAIRDKAVDSILEVVRGRTDTLFTQTFGKALKTAIDNVPINGESVPEGIRSAVIAQERVGWDNLLFGCWSVEWREYLQRKDGPTGRSERLVAAIIERLWETSWDLWLGRNAAVYPRHDLSPEGELIEINIPASRLCRRVRRRSKETSGRACMARWLAGGR